MTSTRISKKTTEVERSIYVDWQNQHGKNGYTTKSNTHVQCNSYQKECKMSNAGGITIPEYKLYYRDIAVKIGWYRHKNRYKDKWNRIEDMNPCSYAHLIFNKDTKNI
jgi:hypothetical protein